MKPKKPHAHCCIFGSAGNRRIACAAALVGYRLRPRRIAHKKAHLHTTQLQGAWHVMWSCNETKRSQRCGDRLHPRDHVANGNQRQFERSVLEGSLRND